MPNDRNARYFDLGYAQSLARKLREKKAPVAAERGPEAPSYVRFQHDRRSGKSVDTAALGQSLREARSAWGSSAWDVLLDGCTRASGGSGAFLLDAQGLVIAARGEVDEGSAEKLGARLLLTLEQAAKMGDSAGVVCMEVDGRWLSGLSAPQADHTALTLGIFAPEPLDREARRIIGELFASVSAS